MIVIYNILQFLLAPLLLFVILFSSTDKKEIFEKLGIGFQCRPKKIYRKTFWFHTDSAREIISSVPLLVGLKRIYPDAEIFFSTTSRQLHYYVKLYVDTYIDHHIPFPFDIRWVVQRWIRLIEPDLFLMLNSYVWPNMTSCLHGKKVPTMLINGRITPPIQSNFKRFGFFFRPFLQKTDLLCMQTVNDRQKLIQLEGNRIDSKVIENLTFAGALYRTATKKQELSFILPPHKKLIVAGSTHFKEEEIILRSVVKLQETIADCYLVIAPSDIQRGAEIHKLASDMNLTANRRSQINVGGKDLFILDTLGELNTVYSHADIAIIGGSLIPAGGHNPVEAAIYGIPVIFGGHMKDYFEISVELMQAGGAIMVRDQKELEANLMSLLTNPSWHAKKGAAAKSYIDSKQGIVSKYIDLVKGML